MEEIERYPYFMGPVIEVCRSFSPDSETGRKMRLRLAVNIGNLSSLNILPEDELKSLPFGLTPEKPQPDKEDPIDTFLDKFGKGKFAPGAYIPKEETPVSTKTQNDSLIEQIKQLIKNQEYSKALEIIEVGNLNNPQKNVYFADQMRFLKKLIIIESHKNKNPG